MEEASWPGCHYVTLVIYLAALGEIDPSTAQYVLVYRVVESIADMALCVHGLVRDPCIKI